LVLGGQDAAVVVEDTDSDGADDVGFHTKYTDTARAMICSLCGSKAQAGQLLVAVSVFGRECARICHVDVISHYVVGDVNVLCHDVGRHINVFSHNVVGEIDMTGHDVVGNVNMLRHN
jgi:hypothetical protein